MSFNNSPELAYPESNVPIFTPSLNLILSVSHLPIPPPSWATIQSESYRHAIPPVQTINHPLLLSPTSQCSCGEKYQPNNGSCIKDCVIYTLTKSIQAQIQLQSCPKCQSPRYKCIGPDCQDIGIFNLNNHALFTHDLLEEYIAAYTSSETPFTAWVKTASIRYQRYNSGSPFVDEKVFRTAWFGYASLLTLEGDFQCPECGIAPDTVIWDGITVGFNQKHLNLSLYLPTTIHPNSISRNCSYYQKQSFISSPETRKLLSNVFSGPLNDGFTMANLEGKPKK
ncbi:hypothetical protein Agabi119p4_9739 [Agaricus bisporus var. burnettii]|uniref:HMG domain-containing protein n=1 Tax=Agaricus bisporus var. burnettii TaxID=192524 RepID=A0A8H7C3E5_AGABI|nr:hypothetical protein Agabi119p4_9739 [Agaricus bisporus var. burnettii]